MSDFKDEFNLNFRFKEKIKKPSKYKVLIHNDDYTPMDFVVDIIQQVFQKTPEDAHAIMMHVHEYGVGIVGVYTYDIAKSKVNKVTTMAEKMNYPLLSSIEEEDES